MKRIPMLVFAAVAALAVWAAPAERGPAASANYEFEPDPTPVLAAVGVTSSTDPKLALRASGAVYLLAVHGGHSESKLGLWISHDGGDTFSHPVPIGLEGKSISSHGENSPTMGFGGTELYVLYEQSRAEDGMGTDLMLARSLNFGHAFDKPVMVTDKAEPSTNAFSNLGVDRRGQVYAVWLDGRDSASTAPGTSSLYLAKSTDRGATFGKNVKVAGGVCPCCRPSIAFGPKGEIFVAWRHVFPGSLRDVVVSTSTDGGTTFSEPVRVAEDNWRINGCPHSGPTLAVNKGKLLVAWYSDGESAPEGVRIATSADGRTFSAPAQASGAVLDANHPQLSESLDGRLLLTFQGREPGEKGAWNKLKPWLVEVSPEGKPLFLTAIPGAQKSVCYPAVSGGSEGTAFVAWTEPVEKGRQVFLSRGRQPK